MDDDSPQALIRELQRASSEDDGARAFGELSRRVHRDPTLALALSGAVRSELNEGRLRTPGLLALLAMTHVPTPEFCQLALEELREFGAAAEPSRPLFAIGAAAIVSQTDPGALLPDVSALQAHAAAAARVDKLLLAALLRLIYYCSRLMGYLRTGAFVDLVRRLWHDLARYDLKSLADFICLRIEVGNIEDPMLCLLVVLTEQLRAGADDKRYVADLLEAEGADSEAVERVRRAWRAMVAAGEVTAPGPFVDGEPPLPEPRVDTALAAFCEHDELASAAGRCLLDEMFEAHCAPPALVYWVLVTVDALPPPRRETEIRYALRQSRKHYGRRTFAPAIPGSIVQAWLETPGLLDEAAMLCAFDLIGREWPAFILRHYAHRLICSSAYDSTWIAVERVWQAIADREPIAAELIVDHWLKAGFESCQLIEMLGDRLQKAKSELRTP